MSKKFTAHIEAETTITSKIEFESEEEYRNYLAKHFDTGHLDAPTINVEAVDG